MLGHRDRGFGQVEDLAALHPGDRPRGQARPAPSAAARLVPQLPVRPGHLGSVLPSCPSWPPGLRPVFSRSDCGRGGGLSSPSLDGGLDEFRGLCLSRASISAIRSRACVRSSCARASAARDSASSPRSAATSAATTSSAEPALSPATPGRYYQPGHPSGDHSSLRSQLSTGKWRHAQIWLLSRRRPICRLAGKDSGCAWPPESSRATLDLHCASGEVPVMTGPQDPAAAGRGRLRAGHADREQAIDTLKTAFVHGQLTKDELDVRAGQALAARTYAGLAALTADIPPRPPAARPARPPAPVRRRPLARAAAKSGVCLIIAAAATWVLALLVSADGHYHGIPGANPSYESWAPLALLLAFAAVCTAIGILGSAVVTSLEQRRS
jgi:hypothetical protein